MSAAGHSRTGGFKRPTVRIWSWSCQPGIDKGGFQLRINNVWFCKVLFLFSFVSQNDEERKQHDCAFVSVLEEHTRLHISAYFLLICIFYIFCIFFASRLESPLNCIHFVQAPIGSSGGHWGTLPLSATDCQWNHPFHHVREAGDGA